jgi:nicotinamidase-related amidase
LLKLLSSSWSGFVNTDLDAQLKHRGIEKIILVGMLANTCIESTARFGMELGYHVILISDATAAFSQDACTRRTRSMDRASCTLF